MLRTFSLIGGGIIAFAAMLLFVGCSTSTPSASPSPSTNAKRDHESTFASATPIPAPHGGDEEHGHKPGAHSGIIVSLGRDSYLVEAIVTAAGEMRLYTLGNDESRVVDVEVQDLIA